MRCVRVALLLLVCTPVACVRAGYEQAAGGGDGAAPVDQGPLQHRDARGDAAGGQADAPPQVDGPQAPEAGIPLDATPAPDKPSGGAAWVAHPQASAVFGSMLMDVWVGGTLDVWAAGQNGGVIQLTKSGWTKHSLNYTKQPYFSGLHGFVKPAPTIYLISSDTQILNLHGTAWLKVPVPPPAQSFIDVWGFSPTSEQWLVGFSGAVRLFVPATTGFKTPFSNCIGAALRAVHGSAANNVFVVGDGGAVCRYDGTGLVKLSSPTSNVLHDVWVSSGGTAWVAGQAATLQRRGAAGQWTDHSAKLPISGTISLNGIWGASDADVWVVGSYGTLLHFDGTAWTKIQTSTNNNLNAIHGIAPSNIWAVGANGTVLSHPSVKP